MIGWAVWREMQRCRDAAGGRVERESSGWGEIGRTRFSAGSVQVQAMQDGWGFIRVRYDCAIGAIGAILVGIGAIGPFGAILPSDHEEDSAGSI